MIKIKREPTKSMVLEAIRQAQEKAEREGLQNEAWIYKEALRLIAEYDTWRDYSGIFFEIGE